MKRATPPTSDPARAEAARRAAAVGESIEHEMRFTRDLAPASYETVSPQLPVQVLVVARLEDVSQRNWAEIGGHGARLGGGYNTRQANRRDANLARHLPEDIARALSPVFVRGVARQHNWSISGRPKSIGWPAPHSSWTPMRWARRCSHPAKAEWSTTCATVTGMAFYQRLVLHAGIDVISRQNAARVSWSPGRTTAPYRPSNLPDPY